jgi:hypothetical protein
VRNPFSLLGSMAASEYYRVSAAAMRTHALCTLQTLPAFFSGGLRSRSSGRPPSTRVNIFTRSLLVITSISDAREDRS